MAGLAGPSKRLQTGCHSRGRGVRAPSVHLGCRRLRHACCPPSYVSPPTARPACRSRAWERSRLRWTGGCSRGAWRGCARTLKRCVGGDEAQSGAWLQLPPAGVAACHRLHATGLQPVAACQVTVCPAAPKGCQPVPLLLLARCLQPEHRAAPLFSIALPAACVPAVARFARTGARTASGGLRRPSRWWLWSAIPTQAGGPAFVAAVDLRAWVFVRGAAAA